ncbi:ligase-associated DNA damage response exonuclease [Spongiivirga citrea]|uniref:Ligase-associated DNA damage response exonuclease n=1 Tax=Spongiivirga citrea TaxID=1481457 RepID=A0A6M0CLV7_9FLAO|nr:ligase-associated DNA damage response exonuclease [Spongiivirga citrea]NER18871.1 ligase-associated DNA damage response exonuclease [Spongiivirga citrea]
MKTPLLQFTKKGIYCKEADVYLDPWRPVDKALITHGHADHSRWGHKQYITYNKNVPIIKHRLGDINVSGVDHNESILVNNVKFSFHPAGHIPGSSQIRVEHKGEVWVFTGDYKTEDDGISTPFQPIECNTFITECTFGLPAFKWIPQDQVMNDINQWWAENKADGQTSIVFAYSLGKAQRVLKHLDPSIGKIYTHGAIENMTNVLRELIDFPETELITKDTKKEAIKGSLVLAPPSAHGSTWIRKVVPYVTASASGWMTFRGARRRRAIDKGFVLSDHCDWNGLLESIEATGAEKVICTHGYTDIFSRYLKTLGYDARTEETQYEGEVPEGEIAKNDLLNVD